MKRFKGEQLKPSARIALLTGEALGNYVVATPLCQMLRAAHPQAQLHYFGGERTRELWEREALFDAKTAFLGSDPRRTAHAAMEKGPFDLVVNLENSEWARCLSSLLCSDETLVVGPILNSQGREGLNPQRDLRGALWRDPDWMAEDLIHWYPFLDSSFIGEIFCRLCYCDGPIPRYRVPCETPAAPVPRVLVSMAASADAKLWPLEKWTILLRELVEKGFTVGIIGARHEVQRQVWRGSEMEDVLARIGNVVDLRGVLSLPQVVGALQSADLVVSIDNGILHLAAAGDTKCVGLYRHGYDRLWAPPAPKLKVVTPEAKRHVSAITVSTVLDAAEL